jgi:hypothetical protein
MFSHLGEPEKSKTVSGIVERLTDLSKNKGHDIGVQEVAGPAAQGPRSPANRARFRPHRKSNQRPLVAATYLRLIQ